MYILMLLEKKKIFNLFVVVSRKMFSIVIPYQVMWKL